MTHAGLKLLPQLVRRDIAGRYRGSVLGIVWSLLTPLLMLAVYTWVFGTVFHARWAPAAHGSAAAAPSTGEFAVILFTGLLVYQLFSEVVSRAPGLVLANTSYVKKVVFPLEILPVVALGSALFHAGVSLAVLLAFIVVVHGTLPATLLLLPVVLAPYLLLILGLSWFLAALGVYLRDIGQVLGTAMTALMFLSPIFFPLSALPEWVRPWVALNPVAFPVEQAREVLIWGRLPDFAGLGIYALAGAAAAALGYAWFQTSRKGFADVL